MKTKIVIWGANEKDEKILVGIELIEAENMVKIYVFPESEAKEDFYNQMINEWRVGNPVVFPENHTVIDRPLSVTETLLPDNIKITRSDVVNRAKAEWHFVVLSSKLYQLYQSELAEIKEKVSNLEVYDKNVWDELKDFWQKVQGQVYDKNLFREHSKELQDETNALFDKLKRFRKKFDEKFKEESKERAAVFNEKLDTISKKLSDGLGLQPLWNEMKSIQTKFRNEKLSKGDRNEIWNKIDRLFKEIKEKKYGSKDGGGQNNALERIENRYKGLLSAIKKMENSIKWDKKDMKFQNERAEGTFGQLEKELRGAKMKMIEERVNSKEMKLAEMNKTKVMLEQKIANEKEKIAKIEESKKIKAKEAELKAKVKQDILEKNQLLKEKMGDGVEATVKEKVVTPPVNIEDLVSAASAKEPVREEFASTEASSEVEKSVTEKVEKATESVEEKTVIPSVETVSTPEAVTEEVDDRSVGEKIRDIAEDAVDSVQAVGKVISDRVSKAIDNITEEE
ncbi:ring-infected erythrocyte surface antigen domain-containing protein [Portibacter lacus]|uniref:Uncharacterized protein n=1 Tax=Portibacter lacus TaxID=1099794 RepID=A0AA37SQQ0_9BACT|nr:hypothetical protein [Portibacter lacus]GLR17799.1 hypothetical protein GCM10007940_24140 [Portibacter lacus]